MSGNGNNNDQLHRQDEKKSECPPSDDTTTSINIVRKLARPNILSLSPYRCARDDYSEGVLLDANENAYGPPHPPPSDNPLSLERYPCPYQIPLKTRYVEYRASTGGGIPLLRPENVFVGVGSDEAIDLLMRIFCRPGVDNILTTPPTYGMYGVSAAVNDVGVVKVPLTPDFDVVVDEILAAADERTKLLFICSPGNPTAKAVPLADIERLLQSFPGIVVVDEAYIDFCPPDRSALNLIPRYPQNLVVMQTLSKAFGLAGIRMGFALSGNAELIQLMNNVKAPYNVNKLTSLAAREALREEHVETMRATMGSILDQRERVMRELDSLDFVTRVYPSDANFVLFRLKRRAKEIYLRMANSGGVVTRYRGTELHCDECIRVTVGTEEENDVFFKELRAAWDEVSGGAE